MSVASGNYV